LVKKSHSREINEGYANYYVTFYTPIVSWVEANYIGEQRFWYKEKIQARYNSTLYWPLTSAYLMVSIRSTEKAAVKKENLRFVLANEEENNDKQWSPKEVSPREIEEKTYLGTTAYKRILDVSFKFGLNTHPFFTDDWVLYLIRKDKITRKEFRWKFEKSYCEGVQTVTVRRDITSLSPLKKCNKLKKLALTPNSTLLDLCTYVDFTLPRRSLAA